MAFTVNGIGTSVCKAGHSVTWDGNESFDAVECLVVAFLPIIPFRSIHTFDWNGINFRMLPVAWSSKLVAMAFLRRWLWGLIFIGVILGIVGVADFDKLPWLIVVAALLVITGIAFLFALGSGSRGRNCEIRRVLGPHSGGTSDPACWTGNMLDSIRSPRELYQAETFADAVKPLLKQERYADAMWAARLSTALEDPYEGERMTDMILDLPEVQEGLEEMGDKSRLWQALFAPVPRTEAGPPEDDLKVIPEVPDEGVQDRSRRRDGGIRR